MRKSKLAVGSAALATTIAVAGVQAAEPVLEEVIVTATKREVSVQRSSLSITALTEVALRNADITDTRKLATQAPGLTIGADGGLGTVPISIRGIGSGGNGIGSDDPVALYIDGVYLGRPSSSVFDLVDLERVEVLRGPQGTLYGRNATGGAISFITKKPNFEETEGFMSLTYGKFNATEARGYVTAPINENFAWKLSGGYSSMDGYAKNIYFGTPTLPQLGAQNPFGEDLNQMRAMLAFRGERIEGSLSFDHGNFAFNGVSKDVRGFQTGVQTSPFAFVDPDTYSTNSPNTRDRTFSGTNLSFAYDVSDSVQLTSITAYRDSQYREQNDSDGTPNFTFYGKWLEDQRQVSQELRLASVGESPLQWIVGGFYFNENSRWLASTYFGIGPLAGTFSNRVTTNETKSYAAFGEVTYQVSERLKAGLGLRYSDEKKDFTYALSVGTKVLPDPTVVFPTAQRNNIQDSAVTPRFVLEYQVNEDVFSYANVSKGFKSGGFNLVSIDNFAPEFIWNYEVGVKADTLDRRLRTNLSVFYSDYSDLQVRIPVQPGQVSVRNAATAEIKGAELEIKFVPTDSFKIEGNVAYLDAKYADFRSPIFDTRPGSPTSGQIISFTENGGKTLNRAPEWKAYLAAEYAIKLAGASKLTLRAEGYHEGTVFFSESNDPVLSRPAIEVFNLRAFFDLNEQARIKASLENVSNKRYLSGVGSVGGSPLGAVAAPRLWTVEMSYRF